MTIALGMRINDGIILAADRLLSTERHQFEDEKLTVWPLNHGEIFFAFSDSPVTAKEVRQKIEKELIEQDDEEHGLNLLKFSQFAKP